MYNQIIYLFRRRTYIMYILLEIYGTQYIFCTIKTKCEQIGHKDMIILNEK